MDSGRWRRARLRKHDHLGRTLHWSRLQSRGRSRRPAPHSFLWTGRLHTGRTDGVRTRLVPAAPSLQVARRQELAVKSLGAGQQLRLGSTSSPRGTCAYREMRAPPPSGAASYARPPPAPLGRGRSKPRKEDCPSAKLASAANVSPDSFWSVAWVSRSQKSEGAQGRKLTGWRSKPVLLGHAPIGGVPRSFAYAPRGNGAACGKCKSESWSAIAGDAMSSRESRLSQYALFRSSCAIPRRTRLDG